MAFRRNWPYRYRYREIKRDRLLVENRDFFTTFYLTTTTENGCVYFGVFFKTRQIRASSCGANTFCKKSSVYLQLKRLTQRWTDGQTERQTDRQTDRRMNGLSSRAYCVLRNAG